MDIDTKLPYINHWKRLHKGYTKEKAQQVKARVEKLLCISQSAFWRYSCLCGKVAWYMAPCR
jgi:hypothetical protein